jgi:hypothetical protein
MCYIFISYPLYSNPSCMWVGSVLLSEAPASLPDRGFTFFSPLELSYTPHATASLSKPGKSSPGVSRAYIRCSRIYVGIRLRRGRDRRCKGADFSNT